MADWNIVKLWAEGGEEERRRAVKWMLAGALLTATTVLLARGVFGGGPDAQPEVFSRLAVEDSDGVRQLVHSDADVVEDRDVEGNTPLHVAVLIGDEPLVRDLLAAGADPEAVNHEGRTPLAETVEGKRPQAAIAAALIDAGADPASVLRNGDTPLHLAVSTPGADPALAPLFARHRPAALAVVDAAGRTPVQLAEARGQKRILAALKQVAAGKGPGITASVN